MIARIPETQISITDSNYKVSKIIKVFFLALQVIFMLDFGYKYGSKKVESALKYFTLIRFSGSAILLVTVIVLNLVKFNAFFYYIYFIQYFINVLILFFCDRKKSLYALLENLLFIDSELNYEKSHKIEIALIVYTVATFIFKLMLWVASCLRLETDCQTSIPEYLLMFMISFSLHISSIFYFFLLYSVYSRLNKLRNVIEDSTNIVSLQYSYKFLIDSTERAKEIFDYLLMMTLLIKTPEILLSIYETIKGLKFTMVEIIHYMIVFIYVLQNLMVVFLPTFFATMLSYEACKLKLVLHDRLLIERGASHVKDIKRFIEYIDARPFTFYICLLIPLNYKFLLIVINFYITYILLIVQFSHIG